jgi:hypothetical protein
MFANRFSIIRSFILIVCILVLLLLVAGTTVRAQQSQAILSPTPIATLSAVSPQTVYDQYRGQFVTQNYPTQMTYGQCSSARVQLKNIGTSTWNGNTKIAPLPKDIPGNPFYSPTWLSTNRIATAGSVAPGQIGTFNFTLCAPSSAGSYKIQFAFVQESVTWFREPSEGQVWFQINVSPPTSSISGRVVNSDNNNNPLANVTLTLSNGSSTTTDVNGYYAFSGIPAGTYTLTPSKNGMSFGPNNHTVTLPPAATGQDFTASPQNYFISGRVTDGNGNAIPGVPMKIDGISWSSNVTTDGNGYYLFSGLWAGYYGVGITPGSSYVLSPPYRTYRLLTYNSGYQDFSTTPHYGSISGKVTSKDASAAIAGAKVVVAGKQTTTDANGNYSISNVIPGNYKISVKASNFTDFSGEVSVSSDQIISKDVALSRLPSTGYYLPYPSGVSHNVTCGHGCYSHTLQSNLYYSYDFGTWSQATKRIDLTIVAANDGVVKKISKERGKAWYVSILHPDKSYTYYVHMDSFAPGISYNKKVYRGQSIGKMGKTGAKYVHLHFNRYSQKGASIETPFAESAAPLAQGKVYISQNSYFPPLALASSVEDTEPPYGSTLLQFSGQANLYNLTSQAEGYLSDVTEMRVSAVESELASAPWQPYVQQIEWDNPVAFAQFKDTVGNVSEVYSDWLDAVGYEPITASFAVSPTVCVNQALPIVNDTTPYCDQCGWRWEFGDGQTSQEIEPQFDPYGIDGYMGYGSLGQYTITLTVSNYDSVSSAQHDIEVLPSPSSDFRRWSIGNTVYVEATDSTAAEFLWDFGDGYTATGKSVSHTYSDPDAISDSLVTLTAIGQNTCSDFSSQYAQGPTTYLPIVMR